MISLVVATANNGVIGKDGALPWDMPAEMAVFRQITSGHPVVMGRKTYESIGRPLPNRTNIVVSRDKNYRVRGCLVAGSIEQAIKEAQKAPGGDEIMVIGGAAIYELTLPIADKIYLSQIHADIEGDRHFKFDAKGWKKISSRKFSADKDNPYSFEASVWHRT